MEFKNQDNRNGGNVYNIETINNGSIFKSINIFSKTDDQRIITSADVAEARKEAGISIILTSIGAIADIKDIFSWLNLPWWGWFMICAFIFISLLIRHGDNMFISNKKIQIGLGGEVLLKEGNSFLSRKSRCPCVYPNCSGVITPIKTPEGYNGPYNLMAECSKTGKQHGYVVDDNFQAYPTGISDLFLNDE